MGSPSVVEDLKRLQKQLRLARLRLIQADEELAALRGSNSWQVTGPLRDLMQRYPRPALLGRRVLRLLEWAYKGELSVRLRHRWRQVRLQREVRAPLSASDRMAIGAMLPFPTPARPEGPKILVVDEGVPEPDRSAGSRTALHILSVLQAEGWSITFWPFDRATRGAYTRNLESLGIAVVDERYGGNFEDWLQQYGGQLDHIMLMRPQIAARLLPYALQYSSAWLSYYGHDLHHVRIRQEGQLNKDIDLLDYALVAETLERQTWRVSDVVLYPSQEEVDEVQRLEANVEARVLPGYTFETFPSARTPPSEETMLFVGGFKHAPNVDAVLWFVQTVLPRILAHRPGARLIIAGSSPTNEVRAQAGPNVEVTGQISDAELIAWYQRARLSIAPLRFGAGVKGKVVEALHAGLPLVTTKVGAQGLPGLTDIVPVHDTVEGQADAILRLLADDQAWCRQSEAQIAYARQHFSSTAFRRALLSALGETETDIGLNEGEAGPRAE